MWRLGACPAGKESERCTDVKFVLPQVEEASRKIKEESLSILFISAAEIAKNHKDLSSFPLAQDFSCPFCSISCLHLEGLKCHFSACHDEFIFEYSVTDDVPDVYVSVNFDQKKSEMADVVDPRADTFIFSSKSLRRRKSQTVVKYPKHGKHISDLVFPTTVNELQHKTDVPESSSAPFARLQNQNWRASVECFDQKKCPLTFWVSPSLSDM
nr:polycomb group protein EMBRYONIC FLOWER 2 isoform X1 [Ipomoea batatas]